MSARRVCYVLGTTGGGTGRHVAMLAWGCALAGRQVQVVGPAGAWPASGFEPRGSAAEASRVNIGFEVVAIGDRLRPGRDSAAVRRLRRLLAATAPDLVHAHGLRAAGLAALALGRSVSEHRPGYRPPALVVTVHNAPPTGAAAVAVYALLERLVARRADVVLGVSSDLSERMSRLGAREVGRAIVPAPSSASASAAGHTRDSASIDGDVRPADLGQAGRPVVLAVGRLAAQKGLDTLIEAAGRWQDRVPQPLLAIAGTGPLARDLAARARRRGVRVSFLGWRDDVPALLAAADVFVLPSRWEGQPLILQEALRAGRPVVATDVGGVRGLTGGHSALLVPPGDPDTLAAAVLSVLDSAPTAARLAAAAADRAAALPTETDAITAALTLYDRLTKTADQRPG